MTLGRPPHHFDAEQLRADVEAGRTITSIAADHHCARKTVRNALHRYGILRPQRRLAIAHPELADADWLRAEYIDKGRSAISIARQFGVSGPTVHDYITRAGITTPGRPGDQGPAELRDPEWLAAALTERSGRQIARDLGVSSSAVSRAVQKLGVEE